MRRRTGSGLAAALAVAVAAAPARAAEWHGWERDLSLSVELDRREAFVGEQVTATVWLLSPAGVAAYDGYRPPPWDGFWVEPLETPDRLAWRLRTAGGLPVRAYLVQRLALFPARAGAARIGPFQLDAVVRVGDGADGSPLRRVRRESAARELRVKPLPPGAPAGFDAANVGRLALAATAPERAAVGEPVAVRIAVSGEGNLRALALPAVPAVEGARRFEPSQEDAIRAKGGRLAGSRTVETVLVPERAGTLVVPPLEWSHFDPGTGRYERDRTGALRIEVEGGPPAAAPEDPLASALAPEVRTGLALSRRAPAPWRGLGFLALALLPPLAAFADALASVARRRSGETAAARRSRAAGRTGRKRLRAARRLLARDPAGAAAAASRALRGFAEDRLGRPVGALGREALCDALAEHGMRSGPVRALSAALDACDAARFGGGVDPGQALALAERAVDLVERATAAAEVEP